MIVNRYTATTERHKMTTKRFEKDKKSWKTLHDLSNTNSKSVNRTD